ncbi:valine--tRNA ligase [Ferrimicrobium sp.]|uniref:valine--tRNA ligase n=1 Tax=Ferrimicrobium TaxID=121038 RepID=UPI00262E5405|nr:valine--tRNA ligase [Ferrimicrobium sp.]
MVAVINVPDKVSLDGLEEKWSQVWEARGTYRFDESVPKEAIYSIDTPPPTVSGSLHIGHVFSYAHADIIARYQRMQGREVFYPVGWDDNGVPTERRVQNYFSVRCDPSLDYEPDFVPDPAAKELRPVSRANFIELCEQLTQLDEQVYEMLWRRVGLSVDWSLTYTTVGLESRKVSQAAFLSLLERGEIYQSSSPTLWDVDFQTAVSQAELEDRPVTGKYHRIRFRLMEGGEVEIETSRPELIPACVGLVVHPDDTRYRSIVGQQVITPLFHVPVRVIAHPLADPEKGTGAAMVCTFGDLTDVAWWRDGGLPLRVIVGRDGRLVDTVVFGSEEFPSLDHEDANANYRQLVRRRSEAARERITELLERSGDLLAPPVNVKHAVKFYEKGERPLEVVASRQWFLRLLEHRDALIQRGRELEWLPPHMRVRYENWVTGLNADWNLSRQRFFGIPIPVWYPLDAKREVDYTHPLIPKMEDLPVDPLGQAPRGYTEDQRGQPGGFTADPDVMDTWATSSLSPQLAGGWLSNPSRYAKVFPMDLRPQGQEIIRTWLFYTVVRSDLEFGELPFKQALISGFVLDPDRKKMSKSKGNVVTPLPLVERFGADALRYWAASGRPGVDTAADEGQMKIGRRLAIKVANATRFVLGTLTREEVALDLTEPHPLDVAFLAVLDSAVRDATARLARNDYTGALETIERVFWEFCDDYLELVKVRAYGDTMEDDLPLVTATRAGRLSALRTLRLANELLLRSLAPYLPFVTEEAWSWFHDDSVHRNAWPQPGECLRGLGLTGKGDVPEQASSGVFRVAQEVLAEVRRVKSEHRLSPKTPVDRLVVRANSARLEAVGCALSDLAAAGMVRLIELHETTDESLFVEVVLAAIS